MNAICQVFGEKMQIKSLFLGAAGIAAVTALSGCSTGSVKGEFDVPYALSTTIGVGGVNIAPTELEVEVKAKVANYDNSGAPNASGEVKVEDENLDLEFEGKISYGFIIGAPTSSVSGLSTEINNALGANIVPSFDTALATSSSSDSTLALAGFFGELEGEDDDDDDDNDDDSNNASNGLFAVVLADFPTCDLSQTILGISKPVTKFVGFAAIDCDAQQGYIAAGFASKGKLKWNIVPPVN
jgi:hypothetical protein